MWVLKTAKEKCVQRLVHVSVDLARQLGTILENVQSDLAVEVSIFAIFFLFIFCVMKDVLPNVNNLLGRRE